MQDILAIALRFDLDGAIETVRVHGNGNVNDTYLVTLHDGAGHAILQRVNTHVFKDPKSVMDNMHYATKHLRACSEHDGIAWQVQRVIPSKEGHLFVVAGDGSFWRMISYIEDSESFDTIYTHQQAYEVGFALGLFHEHINRIEEHVFETVLPGFHVTPQYLASYDQVMATASSMIDDELRYAVRLIQKHRDRVGVLEQARHDGVLPLRVIHGDPKANNIMFHKETGKAISMIDLDTIQPGLVHYDIGDCIRSSCNPLGEELGIRWAEARFDLLSFRYVIEGYIQQGKHFLHDKEYAFIYDAIFLLTFELGLRFLTDYLQGSIYYKISFPAQNKYRALTQFRLAQDIHDNRDAIVSIIETLH